MKGYNINDKKTETYVEPDGAGYEEAVQKGGPNSKPGIKKIMPVVIVAAIAVVMAGSLGVFLFSKNVFGKNSHIITAARNTFGTVAGSMGEFLKGDEYKIFVENHQHIGDEPFTLSLEYNVIETEKRMSISGDISYGDIGGDAVAVLDDTYLKVCIPKFINGTFVYDHTKQNGGEALQGMLESSGMGVDELNSMFKPFDKGSSAFKKYIKMLLDDFNALDFEKIEPKEFNIGGGPKSCSGYRAVVTNEVVEEWIDNYREHVSEETDISNETSKLASWIGATYTVYIYDNRLAAVESSTKNDMMEITFEGAENPLESVHIKSARENTDRQYIGKIQSSEEGAMFKIEDVGSEGGMSTSITIVNSAHIESIDDSLPSIDVGSATKDELTQFIFANAGISFLGQENTDASVGETVPEVIPGDDGVEVIQEGNRVTWHYADGSYIERTYNNDGTYAEKIYSPNGMYDEKTYDTYGNEIMP